LPMQTVYLTIRLPNGAKVPAWPYLKELVVSTADIVERTSQSWTRAPDIVHGGDDGSHSHRYDHAHADPNVCDCADQMTKLIHDEILICIREIESLSTELENRHGVTATLTELQNPSKELDLDVPSDGRRGLFAASPNASRHTSSVTTSKPHSSDLLEPS
jgi:hypothetical protein